MTITTDRPLRSERIASLETAEAIERYVCARVAVELAYKAGPVTFDDREALNGLEGNAARTRADLERALGLGIELTAAYIATLRALRTDSAAHG